MPSLVNPSTYVHLEAPLQRERVQEIHAQFSDAHRAACKREFIALLVGLLGFILGAVLCYLGDIRTFIGISSNSFDPKPGIVIAGLLLVLGSTGLLYTMFLGSERRDEYTRLLEDVDAKEFVRSLGDDLDFALTEPVTCRYLQAASSQGRSLLRMEADALWWHVKTARSQAVKLREQEQHEAKVQEGLARLQARGIAFPVSH